MFSSRAGLYLQIGIALSSRSKGYCGYVLLLKHF